MAYFLLFKFHNFSKNKAIFYKRKGGHELSCFFDILKAFLIEIEMIF